MLCLYTQSKSSNTLYRLNLTHMKTRRAVQTLTCTLCVIVVLAEGDFHYPVIVVLSIVTEKNNHAQSVYGDVELAVCPLASRQCQNKKMPLNRLQTV